MLLKNRSFETFVVPISLSRYHTSSIHSEVFFDVKAGIYSYLSF